MEEYKPDHEQIPPHGSDASASSDDGSDLLSELNDQTEMSFVTESSARNRSTAVVVLTLLLIGGAVIAFMRMKSAPKPASAAAPEAVSAKATINEFLTDGGKNARMMQELLKNTEKLRQRFLNYAVRKQIRLEDLQTNPFRFAKAKTDTPDPNAAAREAEKRRKELADAASRLKLQSIMYGSKGSTCMIANKPYTEGQVVDGFTIEKIQPAGVIVKKDGTKFEIEMQR